MAYQAGLLNYNRLYRNRTNGYLVIIKILSVVSDMIWYSYHKRHSLSSYSHCLYIYVYKKVRYRQKIHCTKLLNVWVLSNCICNIPFGHLYCKSKRIKRMIYFISNLPRSLLHVTIMILSVMFYKAFICHCSYQNKQLKENQNVGHQIHCFREACGMCVYFYISIYSG